MKTILLTTTLLLSIFGYAQSIDSQILDKEKVLTTDDKDYLYALMNHYEKTYNIKSYVLTIESYNEHKSISEYGYSFIKSLEDKGNVVVFMLSVKNKGIAITNSCIDCEDVMYYKEKAIREMIKDFSLHDFYNGFKHGIETYMKHG